MSNFDELNQQTDERLALFRQRVKESREARGEQKQESIKDVYVPIDMADVPEPRETYHDERVVKLMEKAERAYKNLLLTREDESDRETVITRVKELATIMDLFMTEQCKTRF